MVPGINRRARPASKETAYMLTIGDKFPTFNAQAVVSREAGKEFAQLTDKSFEGKWKVVFFWPKDFTFVCPTEIAAFGKLNKDFAERDAQVIGVSTDNEYVHLAWRNSHAGPQGPAVPDAGRPDPRPDDVARRAQPEPASPTAPRSSSTRRASSASPRSPTSASAATRPRRCACSTRCRPTSCARATGRRATRRWADDHEGDVPVPSGWGRAPAIHPTARSPRGASDP
jgi:hypothetical protein